MPTQTSLLKCPLEEKFLEGFQAWVKEECQVEASYQVWVEGWAEGFQEEWVEGFQEEWDEAFRRKEWVAEDKLQECKAGA